MTELHTHHSRLFKALKENHGYYTISADGCVTINLEDPEVIRRIFGNFEKKNCKHRGLDKL